MMQFIELIIAKKKTKQTFYYMNRKMNPYDFEIVDFHEINY